jgi:hypothetical protein
MQTRIGAFASVLVLGALSPPAFATVDGARPTTVASPEAGQPAEPVPGVKKDENLSKQLDEDKGVIKPPPTGDSEIHTTVPDPNPGTMPVIPPPGTPGGDESVQPK